MTYLTSQSFVNRVEESLSLIECSAFLYNVQLIWSGLEQDDMRILYKYLTTSLFPRHSEPELAGRDSPLRPEVARNLLHNGRRVLKHPLWSPASLPPGLLARLGQVPSFPLLLRLWSHAEGQRHHVSVEPSSHVTSAANLTTEVKRGWDGWNYFWTLSCSFMGFSGYIVIST
eukprot:XP_014064411.1 PREDICTED: uncharacterized protein LOC106609888 isoform X2 [Salmo salar]